MDEAQMTEGNGAGMTDGDKTHLYWGVTPSVQIFTFVPGGIPGTNGCYHPVQMTVFPVVYPEWTSLTYNSLKQNMTNVNPTDL
jgi:hypothetical protein